MQLFSCYVLFTFYFFLYLSLSDLVIEISDYFGLHILFLLLFTQTSPVELAIFAEELHTSLNFRKIHRCIVPGLSLIHLLFQLMIYFTFNLFPHNALSRLQIVLKVIQCLIDHLIRNLFLESIIIKLVILGEDVLLFFHWLL